MNSDHPVYIAFSYVFGGGDEKCNAAADIFFPNSE